MTISYPLTLPSAIRASRATWGGRPVVAVGESPYSFSQEVQRHQGQRWEATLDLRPVDEIDAGEIEAFFLQLNGREGTFLMGHPGRSRPRGTAAGSPVVNKGGSPLPTLIRTNALPVRGFTSGTTLLIGDLIQLGSASNARLYQVIEPFTADGSGEGTITLWPNIYIEPGDGDAITLTDPVGVWRLTENYNPMDIMPGRIYSAVVSAYSVP